MKPAAAFVVTGRVQGVGFRQFTVQLARRLGLAGWVRNRADGAVEGCAQGDSAVLDRFWIGLRQGPPGSRVDHLAVEPQNLSISLEPFSVRL